MLCTHSQLPPMPGGNDTSVHAGWASMARFCDARRCSCSLNEGGLMAEASGALAAQTSGELCRLADECWAQDRSSAALEAAWAAFDLAPDERTTKKLLAKLLQDYPAELQPDRRAAYLKLMTDREVEPYFISSAGWQ